MITKYRFFSNFEKEENWLSEMAQQGHEFVAKNVFSGYCFEKAEPKNTKIRIDYRTFSRAADFQDYRLLFEDSGWKHIAGTKNTGTQYFARVNAGADSDIFSDQASKAGRYKRLSQMWLTFAAIYSPLMIVFINNGTINTQAFLNPKLLYYTPGLWKKTSLDFWLAFLFETPFALLRGFSWLFFLLIIGFYLYFAIRTYLTYKHMTDQ